MSSSSSRRDETHSAAQDRGRSVSSTRTSPRNGGRAVRHRRRAGRAVAQRDDTVWLGERRWSLRVRAKREPAGSGAAFLVDAKAWQSVAGSLTLWTFLNG